MRTYERQIKINNFNEVHEQIKKYAVPHGNGTMAGYLHANWMSYQRYILSKVRGGLPASYIVKLHNLGIVFDDDVLCTVFPKSKGL